MSAASVITLIFGQEASGQGLPVETGPDLGQYAILLPVVLGLALLLWALLNPRIGRVFARIFAVLGIGSGIGVLTWGICAAALGDQIRSLAAVPTLVTNPSEAIGLGAGLLVAGIVALVLSFVGVKARVDDDHLV